MVFGINMLNTAYSKDDEVPIPISYVTGTLVKILRGIKPHIAGGKVTDWLGYFSLFASFVVGQRYQRACPRNPNAGDCGCRVRGDNRLCLLSLWSPRSVV